MASSAAVTVRAPVLHAPAQDHLQFLPDALIEVGADGRIERVAAAETADLTRPTTVLPRGRVLVPGFVDLHVHAPQWPQLGTALDVPLERWLQEYTFPLEASYRDEAFAARVWDELVPGLLAEGTTTAVYYATVHRAATRSLAEACVRHGQRAFVGRVAMDHPDATPPDYRDASAAAGIEASAASIEDVRTVDAGRGLVRPVITPRFAPACTDALLSGLGDLAAATGALVQTHCSESDWHHGYAIERFGRRDLEALAEFGLVRPHTVLAHATKLPDEDLDAVARSGACIAHCPLSNVSFGNGVFPARRALARGVRVGLGTDIAGGAHSSVLRNAAMALDVSRLLDDGVHGAPGERGGVAGSRLDATTAFWLATRGGAEAVGLDVGCFEPGRPFDAVALDLTSLPTPTVDRDHADLDAELLAERIVRLAGARNVETVWVAGRCVRSAGSSVPSGR
ncbi:MAG: amidohydrolase family protein [Ilumatobacteraceae bacterium]